MIPGRMVIVLVMLTAARGVSADLFTSDETIALTLTAPISAMIRERDREARYPASIVMNGQEIDLDVQVRGNSRLRRDICRFPPLRLRFDERADGTLFEGMGKLKLVTQCDHRNTEYHYYVMKEYLAYRIFNQLTDYSFRVRLAEVTYIREKGGPVTRYGFFIEPRGQLAIRLNARALNVSEIPLGSLDPRQLNLVSLYQYFIGNVDWAALKGGNEECCHNTKLLELTDGRRILVPYDFDYSGLVNASYALPNRELRQKRVRERLYRGFCRNSEYVPENVQKLQTAKSQVMTLVGELSLPGRQRRDAGDYLNAFYRSVRQDGLSLENTCRAG